ncbi:MAG: ankyrin repeat domain-containing protein [Candidatus Tectomicrobia bacterium]|nr:ankyrin repeat domain-containing protein [Candidatus Tectomicrobia bacterium]
MKQRTQWTQAANHGDPDAQYRLGQLYELGIGVPQNFVRAHFWYNLAMARGLPKAGKARDAIAGKMTPEQIASAQESAERWHRSKEASAQSLGPRFSTENGMKAAEGARAAKPGRAEQDREKWTSLSSKERVQEIQTLLQAKGLYPGPIDGIAGEKTLAAIREFQRVAGLNVDGLVSERLLQSLKENPASRPEVLVSAADAGDGASVTRLIIEGANVNAKDNHGWTPLMRAAAAGHTEVVKVLMAAGADVNLKGENGETPLMAAAYYGHTGPLLRLLAGGADVSAKTSDGQTALMMAQKQGHPLAVKLLTVPVWKTNLKR